MSDLFHARVPIDFVDEVFDVMAETPQHTYQVLTKRAARRAAGWPTTAVAGERLDGRDRRERATAVGRADDLREVPAAVRFLSCRAAAWAAR